jgi:hypothetical protein
MSSAKCPNCAANLPASEIADGWCETCGKRLPGAVAVATAPARGSAYRPGRKRPREKNITFGGVVVLTICMGISLAAAVAAWGSGPLTAAVGCGVGAVVGTVIGRALGLIAAPE